MGLLYKILFEVKVLHEFYLTDTTGETIFDLVAQADRMEYLRKKFGSASENINSDIEFLVPENTQSMFANHRLKILTTYAGFKLGIEVKSITLPDGTITYEPKVPLPDDINIPILIVKKNDFIDIYSNRTLKRPLHAGYYFSNENITAGKTFPFLAAEINSFVAGKEYEQGELVKFPGNYREFYRDDGNIDQWVAFTNGGYANDNDRLLLTTSFSYSFPKTANVTDAQITIKDIDGNVIKDSNGNSISDFHFNSTQNLGQVKMSIDPSRVFFVPNPSDNEKLLYTMSVTGNGGYSDQYKILFMDSAQNDKNIFGLINIKPKVTDPAFNIIDNAGKLITRKQPDGSINPLPPILEIRLRSKLSFWRYINNKRKNIQNGLHPDFMITKNGTLVSLVPRAVTYVPTLFRKADNSLHYLPNPEPYSIIKIENDKAYSDITVRESDLFPLAP